MTGHSPRAYRHRLVVPDIAPLAEYLPFLETVHENGWFSNFGPLVTRFEEGLRAAFGSPHETCVTCANATAGLSAALLAIGRDGPVLLPAFTFSASLGAIRAAGLDPIVADVDPSTWRLGGDILDHALAETGAKIVMQVVPFGLGASAAADLAICRKHGAALVIDNASGLGGPRDASEFAADVFEVCSMHATKPFAVGEGGVVFAHHDRETALRGSLNFALSTYQRETGPGWGFNGKMSEFHAAIGLAQLRRFPDIVHERQAFAAQYQRMLAGERRVAYPPDARCAPWQMFPLLLPDREAAETLVEIAATSGIEVRRYYRPSLSRWPGVRCFADCPVSEDLADRMCALPIRALRSSCEADEIVAAVARCLEQALDQSRKTSGRRTEG